LFHTLPPGVLGGHGQLAGCCECGNEPSRFLTGGTVIFSRIALLHGYGAE